MSTAGLWQRMLLVFALTLGVVAMHAMVLAPVGDTGAADGSGHVAAMSDGHPIADMLVELEPSTPVQVAPLDMAPHHGSGSPSAMHDLLHLCLAILAALVTAVALAIVWFTAAAATRPHLEEPSTGDTSPARPPPRSAVRLALVCVLRN